MNTIKKTAAAVLSASVLLGMCGCSSKINPEVIKSAEELASAITKRDYSKIEALASEGDETLEEILTLPSSCDDDLAAKEIIASTLTYEVDSDSYAGRAKGGSVDVIFTYIDYEPVTADVLFLDYEELEATLSSCEATVEVTLTFDFSKTKEGFVCTNISEAEELFPYASVEFEYALPYSEYAGDITITQADLVGGEYVITADHSSISGNLEITGDGCDILWEYYWVLEDEYGGYITGCPTQQEVCPTNLYFEAPGSFPNGDYAISFYSADYQLIATQEFTIDMEVDTSAAPFTSSSSDSYYVYPSDGIVELPGCDLVVDLPAGLSCLTPDELVDELGSQDAILDLVFYAVDGESYVMAQGMHTGAYDSYDSALALIEAEDAIVSWVDFGGAECDFDYVTYTVGDREFEATVITILTGDEEWYVTLMVIGDGDSAFLLSVYSKDPGFADRIMDGVTIR